jgi:sensor histidine kinase YesM
MLKLAPYFSKIDNHNPLIFNVILWAVSFAVLLFSFTPNNHPTKIDYIYTACFLSTIIVPVLINFYVLIPKFLKKEMYIIYSMLFLANLLVFTQLNIWFFSHFIDYVFSEYFFISYHSNTKLITIFSIFLIATTLLKLSEDWFYFNRNQNRLLKEQNELIQLQLSSLRAQINPHFLFNSLNVIYALSVQKKEGIEDAIVQLSDILRYVIYDSNTERVYLKEEISLLKNYIEFQKHRVHGFENIEFNKNIENKDYKIYPMLLLPLIENCFKHGIKGSLEDTFIKIKLEQKEAKFTFNIENNSFKEEDTVITESFGVGLENVAKNLEIIYPNSHTFNATNKNGVFTVQLTINSK